MTGYRVVWSLRRGELDEPVDAATAQFLWERDTRMARAQLDRDPRLTRKDVQQHELDRSDYRRQQA